MTYLVGSDFPDQPAGNRFRTLLAQPGILQLPGAHNGMAALQAKAAGFEGLYLSGAAMSASMGASVMRNRFSNRAFRIFSKFDSSSASGKASP